MSEIVLETDRLLMRRVEESDAALQFAKLNSPELMDHLGGPKTITQFTEKLARSRALYDERGFGFLFMIERQSGELVGHCGIKLVDHPLAKNKGDLEIGWLVREDRWRRGYAKEAMHAVLRWAFITHDAPSVVALTSDRNRPSWRLMEALGMTRAKELDFDDPAYPPADNPTILYRLTRKDWVAQQ